MTTVILKEENKTINKKNFDKEKFIKEIFLTDEQIKSRLDELDEYYKTNKFVWTPIKEAYINWLKELKFEYGI